MNQILETSNVNQKSKRKGPADIKTIVRVFAIMMIIFGIVIVVVSLVMYVYTDADKTLLTVGNISGILINFVGAVFIRMYTHNVEAAVKFHAKFAESNNLLLANSIANKIEDEKLREETLSEIAKDIIVYNNTISD